MNKSNFKRTLAQLLFLSSTCTGNYSTGNKQRGMWQEAKIQKGQL